MIIRFCNDCAAQISNSEAYYSDGLCAACRDQFAPVPAAPAPEATREADEDWRSLRTVHVDAFEGRNLPIGGAFNEAVNTLLDACLSDGAGVAAVLTFGEYAALRSTVAARARENETLRARAEKAERRLADANETARRLCREREALLTAARDLLNAVERGCGVGGFPPWFGDQARALAALAARSPEPAPQSKDQNNA